MVTAHPLPVSVVLPVKNEAGHIKQCLARLQWAAEIVLVDMFSDDNTVAQASDFPNVTVLQNDGGPRGLIRENMLLGMRRARYDWILFTAADERPDEQLVAAIGEVVTTSQHAGYQIWYQHYFGQRPVRFGGWNGWFPHLIDRRRVREIPSGAVHQNPFMVDGTLGRLPGAVHHYSHPTVSVFIDKLNRYSSQDAAQGTRFGRTAVRPGRITGWTIAYWSVREFVRRYLREQGFRDGTLGLVLAGLMAFYRFAEEAKAWEMSDA